MFRQAYTQIWNDVEADLIHLLTASDRSRLNRDADLETEFLQLLSSHSVRLAGVIEDMSHIDVANPLKRGVSYLLGTVNENRLEELATGCLRGKLQALESGRPPGAVPWWLEIDDEGYARTRDGYEQVVRRIVSLACIGDGEHLIATKLRKEEVKIDGAFVSRHMVAQVLKLDAIRGIAHNFGLEWAIYPVIIDDPNVLRDLGEMRARNRGVAAQLNETSAWSNHLLTNLVRCACGRPLRLQLGPRDAAGNYRYYYCCTKPQRRAGGDLAHAHIKASKLEGFIEELVAQNPNLLTGALSASLGAGETKERMARRAVLEKHVERLTAELHNKQLLSRRSAEEAVETLGISREAVQFEELVSNAVRAMHIAEISELEALKRELSANDPYRLRDRQNERFNSALADLGSWQNLDVLTRNRLLRSVIDPITIYPRHLGGKAVIKLVGIETPLPPVWFSYGKSNELFVPSIGEWIESAFDASATPDHRIALTSATMRPFYQYVRKLRCDGPTGELARAIVSDSGFPKRTCYKPRAAAHLKENGTADTIMQAFEETWRAYLVDERQRIKCRLESRLPAQKPEHVIGGDVLT